MMCAYCKPGPAGIRPDHTRCMGGDCGCGCYPDRPRPIEAEVNGDPVWQCPVCGRQDERYFNGGKSAISIHIDRAHRAERSVS